MLRLKIGAIILAAVSTGAVMPPAAVRKLSEGLQGDLVVPTDKNYNSSRQQWNAAFDANAPTALAYCATEQDVRVQCHSARCCPVLHCCTQPHSWHCCTQ